MYSDFPDIEEDYSHHSHPLIEIIRRGDLVPEFVEYQDCAGASVDTAQRKMVDDYMSRTNELYELRGICMCMWPQRYGHRVCIPCALYSRHSDICDRCYLMRTVIHERV